MEFKTVINFWFKELTPKQWFEKNDELDLIIKNKFLDLHNEAIQGELESWREHPQGRLAEIIVLDQFSCNIFRNEVKSFAFDSLALVLAQEAVRQKVQNQLTITEKSFLYMPFMHSESKLIHEKSIAFFSIPGLENTMDFELKHKKNIDRFGRYPHRNAILGRVSTPEEVEFLNRPGSSF